MNIKINNLLKEFIIGSMIFLIVIFCGVLILRSVNLDKAVCDGFNGTLDVNIERTDSYNITYCVLTDGSRFDVYNYIENNLTGMR